MRTEWLLIAIILASAGSAATPTHAQEPQQHRDSLERRVRVLEAKLDSLQRLMRAEHPDSAVVDELAALRAAGRAIAPPEPADTTPEPSVLRSRSLSQLNPEISVTADVRLKANRPGPQQDNVDVREFGFSFQSALDPYANTKIFVSFGEHHVGVEEAYAYWVGLPGGLRFDIGRFRQQAGELNRWHLHALPESEFPLVIREYLGHHGLVGDGVSLYWMAPFTSPGGGVHELWGQVTLGNNDVLYQGGGRLALLGHLNNFWQLSRSTFIQLGGTAMYGENPDSSLQTWVFGADLRATWRPPERALYRSLTFRSEAFAVRQRFAGVGETRLGGYAGLDYQLSRRIHLGARFDYVELLDGSGDVWELTPRLTWWQSEWVYLRAEWQHRSDPLPTANRSSTDQFVIQVVWSIGPHKHEAY